MTGETVGLCRDCTFAQAVESRRGSTFYRCRLSETDPRFERYPRLPVLNCEGYAKGPAGGRPEITQS